MSTNSLAGAAPSAFYPQLLHLGTGTLAAPFPLRMGDGTQLPITILPTGLGAATLRVGNTDLTQPGVTARGVRVADADGSLFPMWQASVAADATNNTVTPAALTLAWHGLASAPTLPAGSYALTAMVLCRSAATTTGVQLTLTGPAATVCATLWTVAGVYPSHVAGIPAAFAPTAAPVAAAPFLTRLDATFTLDAAGAAPGLSLASEVAASMAEVLAGTHLLIRKVS